MSIKFGYTIVYVQNVKQELEFFKVCFNFNIKFLHDSQEYGELDTGETVLAFASYNMAQSHFKQGFVAVHSEKPLGIEIALVTANIVQTHQHALQHGATQLQAPQSMPWGQVVSYVRSPQGSLIELCTAVG